MARFRLIPKEEKFYDDFKQMADQIRRGARLLEQMLSVDPPIADKAAEIKEVEHQCDFLTHEIIQRLNKTFVTPIDREDIHELARTLDDVMDAIDREDIHELARTLDDVMDAIDSAAALIPLYRIDKIRPGARELTRVIIQQADELRVAIDSLEKRKGVLERSIEINRLENEADRIHKQAISELFVEESNPIMVIKWKEILDLLEEATDACEDVANLLENVVVKHG